MNTFIKTINIVQSMQIASELIANCNGSFIKVAREKSQEGNLSEKTCYFI
jgi:hypothetical protein